MTVSPANRHVDFTLLAKPAGAACNLACQYCFYLEKEKLYPHKRLRMPDNVLQSYIKQYLHSQRSAEVTIAWQGGEPTLMGLDFFVRSVDLVKKYQKPGQQVCYALQTNGTLLDEAWCTFFKQHNFLIGLSLDGPLEMHNVYRRDKSGSGSYERVTRGWDLLQKHRVDTNILCAVHAENASRPLEVYRFLRDNLEARYIQFIPIVERQGSRDGLPGDQNTFLCSQADVSQRSVKPAQFGTFLEIIFDEWVNHDVGEVFIQTFDAALAGWCRLPSNLCVFQEVCGNSLVLEHNGDLYSCDHFVDQAHLLGNILEKPLVDLVKSAQQRQFGLNKRDRLPKPCQTCKWLFACRGECPRNRFVRDVNRKEEGLNYLCASYTSFFSHIDQPMKIMASLLRQQRAPAEIMRMI